MRLEGDVVDISIQRTRVLGVIEFDLTLKILAFAFSACRILFAPTLPFHLNKAEKRTSPTVFPPDISLLLLLSPATALCHH
jgi:hypothetical protein